MSLSSIRVQAQEDHTETLALALQALLRWAGCEAGYADLNAGLGLAFMTSVRNPERCLATWMAKGRDALLERTAPRFGIKLRALHPPEAAAGLEDAPEFAQHFDASYRPLIERALENDQPVLACRGWPGESAELWGIITAVGDEGLGLRGTTPASGGELISLTTPPVQAYVVEEIRPHVPPDDELLRLAVRHADVVLRNQLDRRFGITSGPDVYPAWRERLRHEHVCAACSGHGANCHRQMAGAVTHARESAVEFLSHHRDRVADTARHLIGQIIAECEGVIHALVRSRNLDSVGTLLDTAEGRAHLADDVKLAQAHEERIRTHIGRLGEMLAS